MVQIARLAALHAGREDTARAKQRFGVPAAGRVVSCDEAGRDGFRRHGSSSIAVSRGLPEFSNTLSFRFPQKLSSIDHHVVFWL
jgi:hypothetical protein